MASEGNCPYSHSRCILGTKTEKNPFGNGCSQSMLYYTPITKAKAKAKANKLKTALKHGRSHVLEPIRFLPVKLRALISTCSFFRDLKRRRHASNCGYISSEGS